MARLNAKYGSELHLLRMLGRHREFLNLRVCEVTKADAVEWLDYPPGEKDVKTRGNSTWDREWQQLDFLSDGDPAKAGWPSVWPAQRQGQSWDAVGQLSYGDRNEWLLVEAKANIEELASTCKAADPRSRGLIAGTLSEAKRALGVPEKCDWLSGYYQFCNRLAVLNWMNDHATPARLLYIYFTGDNGKTSDDNRRSRTCPETSSAWSDALKAQDAHVGLRPGHRLDKRIHKLFIDVRAG